MDHHATWPTAVAVDLSTAVQAVDADGTNICVVVCEQPKGRWTGDLTLTPTDGAQEVHDLDVPGGLDEAGMRRWLLDAFPDGGVSIHRTDAGRRLAAFKPGAPPIRPLL